MNFQLTRQSSGLYGIYGKMVSEDGKYSFATLEHAYPDGAAFVAKLAVGTYTCERYDSPERGYVVFLVKGVPKFQGQSVSYIEIHIGNYNKDSKGCILLGLAKGTGMIEDSRPAFEKFMELQKDVDSFTLIVA